MQNENSGRLRRRVRIWEEKLLFMYAKKKLFSFVIHTHTMAGKFTTRNEAECKQPKRKILIRSLHHAGTRSIILMASRIEIRVCVKFKYFVFVFF